MELTSKTNCRPRQSLLHASQAWRCASRLSSIAEWPVRSQAMENLLNAQDLHLGMNGQCIGNTVGLRSSQKPRTRTTSKMAQRMKSIPHPAMLARLMVWKVRMHISKLPPRLAEGGGCRSQARHSVLHASPCIKSVTHQHRAFTSREVHL